MLVRFGFTALLLVLAVGQAFIGAWLLKRGWTDGIRKREWMPDSPTWVARIPAFFSRGPSDAEMRARGWPVRGWRAVVVGTFAFLAGLMITASVPLTIVFIVQPWSAPNR